MADNSALLKVHLQAAVPIRIAETKGMTFEERREHAQIAASIIAESGDNILFRSRKQGESARAVNALVNALALLSYQPGGVTFMGLHFETLPADASPSSRIQEA